MEWFYKRKEPSYQDLPPVMEGCMDESIAELEIVYPEWDSHLVIPRELDGSRGRVVLEVSHRQPDSRLFWHLDDTFVGETYGLHQLALDMDPGMHYLNVIDEKGNRASVRFEVLK